MSRLKAATWKCQKLHRQIVNQRIAGMFKADVQLFGRTSAIPHRIGIKPSKELTSATDKGQGVVTRNTAAE